MKTSLRRAALACAALLPLSVQAGDYDQRWYIAPSVSYIFADEHRQADDDFGVQIGVGKPVNEKWNVELTAVDDSLERDAGGEFDQTGMSLDSLYFFTRNHGFAPYLTIGLGLLRTEFADNADTHTMVSAGVGFMSRLNDYGLALRTDARYRMDNDNSSIASENGFGDWLLNVGLVIPFGSQAKAPAAPLAPVAVAAAPKAADSDGDGIADGADRCPGSAPGVKVDANGCEPDDDKDGVVNSQDRCPDSAPGAKVDAAGCELDGDKDGVVDSQDKCPSTPAGVKVDARGCELDSDGDGIVDGKDQCPGTQAGVKVDNKGCELQATIKLEGVTFTNNSARLQPSSVAILDDAAEILRRHADLKIEVAGHTDNRGNRAYNVRLSQQRAEAVKQYLIDHGVNAANLSAKGYGPGTPIADNASASGRAANRRVELRILGR